MSKASSKKSNVGMGNRPTQNSDLGPDNASKFVASNEASLIASDQDQNETLKLDLKKDDDINDRDKMNTLTIDTKNIQPDVSFASSNISPVRNNSVYSSPRRSTGKRASIY